MHKADRNTSWSENKTLREGEHESPNYWSCAAPRCPPGKDTWSEVWLTLLITVFLIFEKINIFEGKNIVVLQQTQITFMLKKNPKK